MASLLNRTENNFWTEDTKIVRFDDLVKIDLKNKIKTMENQIVDRDHLADYCYNYDYFIFDKEKALQFITDYSDNFIKALNRYQEETGHVFKGVINPSLMANLMVLYKAKDIIQELDVVKENSRLVLNSETKNALIEQLDAAMSPEMTVYKVFTDKDNLLAHSVQYIYDNFQHLKEEDLVMEKAVDHFEKPAISEKVAKSILKNDYSEVANLILNNVSGVNTLSFIQKVILENSKTIISNEYDLKQDILDKKSIEQFEKNHSEHLNIKPSSDKNRVVIVKKEREK